MYVICPNDIVVVSICILFLIDYLVILYSRIDHYVYYITTIVHNDMTYTIRVYVYIVGIHTICILYVAIAT